MSEIEIIKAAQSLPLDQRAAFVLEMCGSDPALRERLLQGLSVPPNSPASSSNSPAATDSGSSRSESLSDESDDDLVSLWGDDPHLDSSGSDESSSIHANTLKPRLMIGPYRLLQPLGEGGMGSVWLAEQSEPVKRRVALKVIKNWGNSKEILARFEVERQALAMMNHPNIARILDAGSTPSGQPYFAMELVQGQALTDYCDENRLGLDERLTLFSQVCSGIQHAHQKGVIHRDLKPSNVLVAMVDGKPVVKVIDFGLAKAIESTQKLTDHSLFTGIGQIMGTLKYMSPEQAKLGSMDVDTRTDIYALGVLLYELLTGSTPLEDSVIKEEAILNILTFIRERDPVKPSSRLSSASHEQASQVTQKRSIDRSRLSRILSGDLDWIVMKALEKDRTRRYESAAAFSEDIRRYANNEPVIARPPSLRYKIQKFVRKNRVGVMAASLVSLTLVVGIVGTSLAMVRAWDAEELAEGRLDEAVAARQAEAKQRALAEQQRRNADNAREIAEDRRLDAEKSLAYAETGNAILSSVFADLDPMAEYEEVSDLRNALSDKLLEAVERLEVEPIGDPLVVARMQTRLGVSLMGLGQAKQAIVPLERALQTRTKELGTDDPETIEAMGFLAQGHSSAGLFDSALPLLEKALQLSIEVNGPDNQETLTHMSSLAEVYRGLGQMDKALPLLTQSLEISMATLGSNHRHTLTRMNNLGTWYQSAGQMDEALPLMEKTLELRTAQLGRNHVSTLTSMSNLAGVYLAVGQSDKAIGLWQETLDLRNAKLGPEHPQTMENASNLAVGMVKNGQLAKALPLLERTFELRKSKLGNDHPDTLVSMTALGAGYIAAQKLDKALPLLEQAFERSKVKLGLDHVKTLEGMNSLAECYSKLGQLKKAIEIVEQALDIQKDKFSLDHPATLTSMNNLATLYWNSGQKSKAVPLMEQALEAKRIKLGPDHSDTLTSMDNLAAIYTQIGRPNDALPLLEQTLEVWKSKFGPGNMNTLRSMNNLGMYYQATNNPNKALPLLERVLDLSKEKLGTENRQTLKSMDGLALCYRDMGQLDKALPLLEQAFAIRKNKLGLDHLETMNSMNNLAACYANTRELGRALPLWEQILEFQKGKLDPDHPDTLRTMNNLARGYLDAEQPVKALALLEKSLELTNAKFGPDHPDTLANEKRLLDAYATAGETTKFSQLYPSVLLQLRKSLSERSSDLARELAVLGSEMLQLKLAKDAEPLLRESLQIRQEGETETWTTFNTQVLLGRSLLAQAAKLADATEQAKLFAEAESLLVSGYEGMKEREASIPPQAGSRLPEALDGLMELYTLLDQSTEVEKYRVLRAAYPMEKAK